MLDDDLSSFGVVEELMNDDDLQHLVRPCIYDITRVLNENLQRFHDSRCKRALQAQAECRTSRGPGCHSTCLGCPRGFQPKGFGIGSEKRPKLLGPTGPKRETRKVKRSALN